MLTTVRAPTEPLMVTNAVDSIPKSNLNLSVGAVAYLNTKPLIYDLEDRLEGFGELHLALPSQLATQMQNRLLDVGLIPVVEYLRNRDDYRLISDAGIACRGPVWSVRVLFRVPPEEVRSLGTDEGSRTSVALSQVLLASRFGRLPELVAFPIDSEPKDCPADAVLVIGDRAMNPERFRSDFFLDWDLGQQWYLETRLPFVFAMWVARKTDPVDPRIVESLEASRDAGCENVEAIIAKYAKSYGLSDAACREYLTHFLRFRIGSLERQGLEEFSRRCTQLGLA
ncbi:MAG: menaquinone biosynthesis protein [Planctomycetota bacterium]|nr:menaquinone biosynthesis protein [Planctomycetota bacterium]